MVLVLVGFIVALSYKGKLETVYRDRLLKVLTTALNTSDTRVLDAFVDLEKSLNCCGVNGINDYHGTDPRNPNCYRYKTGCSTPIIKMFNDTIPIIGLTLGLVLLFELVCLINAILLAITLKKSSNSSNSSDSKSLLLNTIPHYHRDYYGYQ